MPVLNVHVFPVCITFTLPSTLAGQMSQQAGSQPSDARCEPPVPQSPAASERTSDTGPLRADPSGVSSYDKSWESVKRIVPYPRDDAHVTHTFFRAYLLLYVESLHSCDLALFDLNGRQLHEMETHELAGLLQRVWVIDRVSNHLTRVMADEIVDLLRRRRDGSLAISERVNSPWTGQQPTNTDIPGSASDYFEIFLLLLAVLASLMLWIGPNVP